MTDVNPVSQIRSYNNNIRLIALDLDDTVLTSEKKITARNKKAIEGAIKSGKEIVYTTGRPLSGIPDEVMNIPGIRYVVTSNGAVTYDLKNNSKLRTSLMSRETAEWIVSMPELSGLVYSVFIDGLGYCDMEAFEAMVRRNKGTKYEEYVRKSRRGVEDIFAFIKESVEGIENIWITAPDQLLRDTINEKIKSIWDVRTVITGHTDVEAGHPGCDKGLALKDLAAYLNIDMKNVMAIGDNDNDRGMLAEAGISVAMGNALDCVKQSAAFITDTNNNDGVAKVLELFG